MATMPPHGYSVVHPSRFPYPMQVPSAIRSAAQMICAAERGSEIHRQCVDPADRVAKGTINSHTNLPTDLFSRKRASRRPQKCNSASLHPSGTLRARISFAALGHECVGLPEAPQDWCPCRERPRRGANRGVGGTPQTTLEIVVVEDHTLRSDAQCSAAPFPIH